MCWQIIFVCCERLLELACRSCRDESHKSRLFISSDRFVSADSLVSRDSLFHSNSPSLATSRSSHTLLSSTLNGNTALPKNPLIAALRSSISAETLSPLRTRPSGIFSRTGSPGGSVTASLAVGSSEPRNGSTLPLLASKSRSWTTASIDPQCDENGHLSVVRSRRGSVVVSAAVIVEAFAAVRPDYPSEVVIRLDECKQRLNTSPTEWWQLRMENEPMILAGLVWDWLDELQVINYITHWQFVCTVLVRSLNCMYH